MRKQLLAILFAGISMSCGSDGDGGGGPQPTNTLAKAAGDNQVGVVNTALPTPLCARVTAAGSNKEGVTVNWTAPNGGSMSVPSSVSNDQGIACATMTLGTVAGAQIGRAAVSGATGSPVNFNVTAQADAAVTIASTGGDNQTGIVNTELASPLSVKVADQFGNGVASTLVTWSVTSGAATTNPTGGNTDASGIASTVVTLGGTPGAIVITASSVGLNGSPMSFDATADPAPVVPTAITITVVNSSFGPPVDTVAVGGTVTFQWDPTATLQHSVTSINSPSFTSDPAGLIAAPHTYGPITFNTAGTYDYYCTNHGFAGDPPTGMAGRIVVM